MDRDDLGLLFGILLMITASFCLGFDLSGRGTDQALEECRKKHNVYQCKVEYVPVERNEEMK